MARKASVRYWQSRKAYCCEIAGVQHVLAIGPDDAPSGPNFSEACRKFGQLMAGKGESGITLSEVSAKYLDWLTHHREIDTLKIRTQRLNCICADMGNEPVARLTAYSLESFCDKKRISRGWTNGTIKLTMMSVISCLNWAVDKGLIAKNPIGKLDLPEDTSRGLECVLSEDEVTKMLAVCKRSLRDFVQVIFSTGARPGELARAEAKHFDANLGALVYQANRRDEKHKTAKKTKRARVIYLTGESLEIVQRLVALHPTGPLFRTSRAKAKGPNAGKKWGWSAQNIAEAFIRLRRKTGIKGLVAYSGRHTFAVRWLRANKPIAALSEVLGTSIRMIQYHYGHLADQHDYLRGLIDS